MEAAGDEIRVTGVSLMYETLLRYVKSA